MPIIELTLGKVSKEQKKALIHSLTATAVEVTQIPQEAFTVLLHELEDDAIGVAGVSLEQLKAEH